MLRYSTGNQLVLSHRKGYMFWTECDADSVMRAKMDGSEVIAIVKDFDCPSECLLSYIIKVQL